MTSTEKHKRRLLAFAVEPKQMPIEVLTFLEDALAQYKNGSISSRDEDKLEEFVGAWIHDVRQEHPSAHLSLFARLSNELTFVVLAELDYLVREELKSRRLGYQTYGPQVQHFFERDRLKHIGPDFLRAMLRRKSLLVMAEGDLTGPLSAISKLFEHSVEEAYS
ncbi:hypothetical protein [Noviherbaspirillum aerium]|uniref:hypothetical protein n=1 Tax=Noviherbaspirillum aerium TaxID=2588497 RepID=UPI00124CDA95|nr:hypothetical protein [Noviherbaspirillum aerium]